MMSARKTQIWMAKKFWGKGAKFTTFSQQAVRCGGATSWENARSGHKGQTGKLYF